MKIQIDTNIVIDYGLIRQPFYDNADLIFSLIVTRNPKDYPQNSKIAILTPEQFLKYFT